MRDAAGGGGARLRWSRRMRATSYGEVSPERAWNVSPEAEGPGALSALRKP
jgi:hypothetical protein